MSCEKIKIVLAGRQRLIRNGIRAAIDSHPDMEVVDEVDHHSSTTELVRQLKPDVIIIDGLMPGSTERECAARIIAVIPAKVIILSAIPSIDCANRMFDLGAAGYLLKNCSPAEVPAAIRLVSKGKKYISQQIVQQVYSSRLLTNRNCHLTKLTSREKEVICFITAGHSVKQIASCLGIMSGTVKTFKKRVREKLRINNDIELTKFAIRNGFASLDAE